MSSKHTRYVRQIDANRSATNGGFAVFSGAGGPAVPASGQVAATDVLFAPAGNIQAMRVQGAIEEMDAEKLGLAGGTMTGILILADMLPNQDHEAASKWYVDNLDHLLVPGADGVPVVRLLPDFVRIGHPLQPGLTWTPEQGVRLPASCITDALIEYGWHIEAFTGTPGLIGAVYYISSALRLVNVAIYVQGNSVGETAELIVVNSTDPAGLDGAEFAAVVGTIEIEPADVGLTLVMDELIYDGDTGDPVTSGVSFVATGDEPLIPAGSWLALWESTAADEMTGVTVSLFMRNA